MSHLLFDEQPIVIDRTMAKKIGLNESIILQQLHYWIKINETKKQNFYEGKYWTYNSIRQWHEEVFSFWSYDTVKRAFKSLEDKGILITGNFNKEKRDQTKWYTIDYEILNSLAQCIGANCTNGIGQNAPMHQGNLPQPLPEITTEITTENTTIHNEHCAEPMPNEDIADLFNNICTTLPKIQGIKGNRKKAIQSRWKENPNIEFFENLFKRVDTSNFLSGRSDNSWNGCCFDWIMKPSNMQKILEGNYDNKDTKGGMNNGNGGYKPNNKQVPAEYKIPEREVREFTEEERNRLKDLGINPDI